MYFMKKHPKILLAVIWGPLLESVVRVLLLPQVECLPQAGWTMKDFNRDLELGLCEGIGLRVQGLGVAG